MDKEGLLRFVDTLHRDKGIEKEVLFQLIENAVESAVKRRYDESDDISIIIDREEGGIEATRNGETIVEKESFEETLSKFGRVGAQTAKQVLIQKVREAERDALFNEFQQQQGMIVTGSVGRKESGAVTVNIGKTEGILPSGEQIPGETHRSGERVRATILEVRKSGTRVRVILSRKHPEFVRRLFEIEIPEIAEKVIEIKALAREAGYRSKVAVASVDQQIDCVGACVGVRGARIKNIVDELGGERLDIVRWNEDPSVFLPNALKPAEVDTTIFCQKLGRAIIIVNEDQLSLAIGRRGQNVRLASKLCGWDMEIMTDEELSEQIENATIAFSNIPGVSEDLACELVEAGFFSFDDLSIIEPDDLMAMGNLTAEQVDAIVEHAETAAEELEQKRAEERRLNKIAEAEATEAAATAETTETETEAEATEAAATTETTETETEAEATEAAATAETTETETNSDTKTTEPSKTTKKSKNTQ